MIKKLFCWLGRVTDMKPMWIIYVGGMISVIGVFLKEAPNSVTMIVVTGTIITITGTLLQNERSSERNDKLSSDLQIAREENKELNERLLDVMTGINSYCFIHVLIPSGSNQASLYIKNPGVSALKNIQIEIVNTENDLPGDNSNIQKDPADRQRLHLLGFPLRRQLDILLGDQETSIGTIEINRLPEKSINVQFRADNGNVWYQRIILRRIADYPSFRYFETYSCKDNYISATQVYKREFIFSGSQDPEVIIFEGIQRQFSAILSGVTDEVTWEHFPLDEGQSTPFVGLRKLHYSDGGVYHPVRYIDV